MADPARQTPTGRVSQTYAPRTFRWLGLWESGTWALKAYGIHHAELAADAPMFAPAMLAAAREHVERRLAVAEADGHHHDTGFAVLHQGTLGNWLLLHWWVHEGICARDLSFSEAAAPERFAVVTRPLMACVWELAVMDFERRAWVRTMLNGKADRGSYLAQRLADGRY